MKYMGLDEGVLYDTLVNVRSRLLKKRYDSNAPEEMLKTLDTHIYNFYTVIMTEIWKEYFE